jgi:signal peptidase I
MWLFAKAAFFALLLYQFVFQVFVVRQSSMRPTFQEGDWVVVDKLTYRFTTPRPGDVVVFELMVKDRDTGRRVYRDYIKRVVAGPLDRVRIVGDAAYVNGRRAAAPEGQTSEEAQTRAEGGDEYFVPPGNYFVMGDNRADSRDSRYDALRGSLGFIPRERMKGKVRWRCWPHG